MPSRRDVLVGGESSIAAGQQFVPHKLRLRGTFIDCEDENSDDGVTPHARSDPGLLHILFPKCKAFAPE